MLSYMKGKHMKNFKIRKEVLIAIGIFLLVVIATIFGIKKYQEYKYHQTLEYKLLEKGYSIKEYQILKEKLTSKELNSLLSEEKNEQVLGIVKEKYFIKANYERYLSYLSSKEVSFKEVVALVNVNADYGWYNHDLVTKITDNEAMIVNKFYKLPDDFDSGEIVPISNWYAYDNQEAKQEVIDAFISMWNKAKEEDIKLVVSSGYRSFEDQSLTYDSYYKHYGLEYADSIASRAGYSEHQTGLSIDIFGYGMSKEGFEETKEAMWLANNSYKYGFILRYPKDKETITGYNYEPWHFRYLGKEIATAVYEEGITYDEYYAFYLNK